MENGHIVQADTRWDSIRERTNDIQDDIELQIKRWNRLHERVKEKQQSLFERMDKLESMCRKAIENLDKKLEEHLRMHDAMLDFEERARQQTPA